MFLSVALVACSDALGPDEICFNLAERKNAESKELLIQSGAGGRVVFKNFIRHFSLWGGPASARVSYGARRSPLICSYRRTFEPILYWNAAGGRFCAWLFARRANSPIWPSLFSLGAAAERPTSRFEHFDLLKRSPLCAVFWQSRDLFDRLLLIIAEQCEYYSRDYLMHYAKAQFLMLFLYLLVVLQECAQTGEVLAHGFHSAPHASVHSQYIYYI
jgi:hypothetical protein